ncbi:MAG: tRNA (adenosine(37)-N6)-dimethylallyltransferase MiaA [Prevotellaceae bacterium]|jgi:tRNA dimethylallyltransferase|nr:tRNA (adenosine(37)-N6)-dimethylallyltransferase MiaA [Prevotellaceae bacterium]
MKNDLVTILGVTACGKTAFATTLACELGGEIISADSRQVYRRMDIGTGKDLSDYTVNGRKIPCHLIDIAEAGEKYNLFEYKRDFFRAYETIKSKGYLPILCGGTGLYIEAVLNNYDLPDVPQNPELRENLAQKSLSELTEILKTYKTLHNKTDVDTAQRAIRAIEIAEFQANAGGLRVKPAMTNPTCHCGLDPQSPLNSVILGLDISREDRRKRISERLQQRLQAGMIDEVHDILQSGVAAEDLIYYGLEYKYVTNYILGKLTYEEMFSQLEIAIHQFAKRQMTWFRGMERRGFHIHWIDALLPMAEKVEIAKEKIYPK